MSTKVHRNLHKACWSIRRKGAPTAHDSDIVLANVVFRVSEKARQKVLADKVRSVHAYAQGEETQMVHAWQGDLMRVRYSPYRAGAFTLDDGREVWGAKYAWFKKDGSCEVIL